MPVYEFKCTECGEVFSEIKKIGDYQSSGCPKCKSLKTEKIFSMFSGNKSNQSCSTSGG
jgi:putative FmdB family regulatory protein